MCAEFEVLIFRVTSVRYCLISQNGQVVENWKSASRTEIRTTDLATMDHQDDNHEMQRPTDWPVQWRTGEVASLPDGKRAPLNRRQFGPPGSVG
ncbi:hypothetical protein AVEN_117771-1 [Araneus ventricosus]|uniref:Uncharacterized protein n=1 Tax=Araneus ventricosus TaxID=182803 RepID=A0A4Y2BA24_ARAVE|nr:hypothetical protein AVEN_117771-1 [Araneus ventricosus]